MAGNKQYPAAGYLTDAAREEDEFKQGIDDWLSATMTLLGSDAQEAVKITAGVLAATQTGVVEVEAESGTIDTLTHIPVTNYEEGRLLIMSIKTGNVISITHAAGGSGQLLAYDGVNWGYTFINSLSIFQLRGTSWQEIVRWYGGDVVNSRTKLGLGTAALLDDGSIDAATLEGNAAAAFLGVAAQAADSALLDGKDSADFLDLTLASLQEMTGSLRTNSSPLYVNDPVTPQIDFQFSAFTRCQVVWDSAGALRFHLLDTGGVIQTSFSINQAGGLFTREGGIGGSWAAVWTSIQQGAGSGMDSDKVDGFEGADLRFDGPTQLSGTVVSGARFFGFETPIRHVPCRFAFRFSNGPYNPGGPEPPVEEIIQIRDPYFREDIGVMPGTDTTVWETPTRMTGVENIHLGGFGVEFRIDYFSADD